MMWPQAAAEQPSNVVIQAEPTSQVLVASTDLVAGHRLTAADMTWKPWASNDLNPLYIVDGTSGAAIAEAGLVQKASAAAAEVADLTPTTGAAQDYVGAVVRDPILAGEPIVERKLIRAGDAGYLSSLLEPGMKAMALRVSVETAAGGFILPGDRVDVILAREVTDRMSDGTELKRNVITTVMRNLKVLAVDQSATRAEDNMAVVGATATVAVSGPDAEALALARAEGSLSLVLRSYADTLEPSGRVPGAIASGGSRRVSAPSSGAQDRTVTIYRQVQPEVVAIS
jgi:pilus assembly protein CpaB